MSYLAKVEAAGDPVSELVRALRQTVGNKVFMNDIEKLFEEKLSALSPQDEATLFYLVRALKQL